MSKTAMEKTKESMRNNKVAESNQKKSAVQALTAWLDSPKAQNEIFKACSAHITPERLIRIARTAASRQPELWACTPISFLGAVIDCAQLGLEPLQSLGHVYLIPYRNRKNNTKEVVVQLGYKGMIALALRSGRLEYIEGKAIFEHDRILEYEEGSNSILRIKSAFPNPKGQIIGAYAKAVFKNKDISPLIKLVDMEEIKAARERSVEYSIWVSKGSKKDGKQPVWNEHFEAMAIKTAIRRMSPFLAMEPQTQDFFQVDNLRDAGINSGFNHIAGSLVEANYEMVDKGEKSEDQLQE